MWFSGSQAIAGPFGVNEADPVSSLSVIKKIDDETFEVNVPMPDPAFEGYTVKATVQNGVCRISGIGKNFENDMYGTQVRQKYEEFKAILSKKYGPYKSYEFSDYGDFESEEEWVMAVQQTVRVHRSLWTKDSQMISFENVATIILTVQALNSDTSFIGLIYEFSNFDKCKANFKDSDKVGL